MRRYPEVEEQYPGRSMCSIPGAQISDSNTADTAVEGTKLIPRLQVDGGSRAQSDKKYLWHLAERMFFLFVGVMPLSAVVKHAMSFCP